VQAAAVLGQAPTVPEGEVQFFVCYLKPEDNPIYAFVVESEIEEESEGEEEETPATADVQPPVAELAIPPGTYSGSYDEASLIENVLFLDTGDVTVNRFTIVVGPEGQLAGDGAIKSKGFFLGCPAYNNWTIHLDSDQFLGSTLPVTLAAMIRIDDMSGDVVKDTCNPADYDHGTYPISFEIFAFADGIITGRWIDIEEAHGVQSPFVLVRDLAP